MIKVNIQRKNNDITSITITGHAEYADKGQDIVCAAASSIAFGLLNALDIQSPDTFDYSIEDNLIGISCHHITDVNQIVLKTGMIQLQTIEESYPEFINIKLQEV